MVGRSHDGERVGGKGDGFAVQVAGRAAHDHQVGFVARHHAQNVFAVVDAQLDVDTRKLLAKAHQQHGNEVFGGTDHGQVDAAFFHADVLGHQGFQVFELAQGGNGVGQKSLARVGELDVA